MLRSFNDLKHSHTDWYLPRHKRGHGLQHISRIKWPKADSSEATFWNHQESNECLTKWPQSLKRVGVQRVKRERKRTIYDLVQGTGTAQIHLPVLVPLFYSLSFFATSLPITITASFFLPPFLQPQAQLLYLVLSPNFSELFREDTQILY